MALPCAGPLFHSRKDVDAIRRKLCITLLALLVAFDVTFTVTISRCYDEIDRLEQKIEELSNEITELEQPVVVVAEVTPEEPDVPDGRYDSIALTDDEYDLLALCVYHEARGESFEGQRAVAEVVLNRVLNAKFPNSVTEVLYQKGQFSTASMLNLNTARDHDSLSAAYDAVDYVLEETDYVFDSNVGYFRTTPYKSCSYEKLGNHYFARM